LLAGHKNVQSRVKELEISMRTFFYTLCTMLFFSHLVFSEEKKDPKVLVLIIASDHLEAYVELQKIWKSYMRSDPEHFEVYFIRGNPELTTPYAFEEDDLYVKSEENYVPGIVDKTILSMEAMLPRLKEFDYVLRTNLSSFYVFPRLLRFVSQLPKQDCYCGIYSFIPESWLPTFGQINFVSGAGILLSADLAERLVLEKEDIFRYNKELPDDVLIGYFFQNRSIPILPAGRQDFSSRELWMEHKDHIPEDAFHFRAKQNYNMRSAEENFADELYIDRELLKMFYP
jgi:hypothetical protein